MDQEIQETTKVRNCRLKVEFQHLSKYFLIKKIRCLTTSVTMSRRRALLMALMI